MICKQVNIGNLLPIDDAGLDNVVELEDDESVGEVRVQPVDVRRHAHGVHPVAVRWGTNIIKYYIKSL